MKAEREASSELRAKKCFFDRFLLPLLTFITTFTNSDSRLSLPSGPIQLQLTNEEVRAESVIFTSAALEGVAAFLSPFVDNVIQNPSVYMRLQAEIDDAEARGLLSQPIATYGETCKLPYFMACISETLRHDSPAQTILPRLVSKAGIFAHDRFIPGGTEIAASPCIIHCNTKTFGEDANVFRPERWLEDPKKRERMERFGMWFGYGDRECPGKNFAYLEIHKVCLELFRRFEIQTVKPETPYRKDRLAVAIFYDHWLLFKKRQIVTVKANSH